MKMKRYFSFIIAFMLLATAFLSGCESSEESSAEPSKTQVSYKLSIKTNGGMAMEDIGVYVYKTDSPDDLVWGGYTDKNGAVDFFVYGEDSLFAVLKEVPAGYTAEQRYSLTEGANEITLSAVLLDESALFGQKFKLGSVSLDFSFDTDGKQYKLSEILKEKQAVVLNFWYINCGPCRSEFPYIKQAYEKYSDKLELIAINPYDGTADSVAAYKNELGLEFPVVSAESRWQEAFGITAYPTTIVIDRFGTVAMVHHGSFADAESVEKIFDYFTSEDYVQTTVRNLSDIK